MYDRYPENWVPTLRAKRSPVYMLPHVLYAQDAPSIQGRLNTAMDLLASWHFEEVAPEVLVEEIHTIAELLLERNINLRAKRLSFAELVNAASARGVFLYYWYSAPSELDAIEQIDKATELLIGLKDVRKNVRHRGADGAREWLDVHFWDAASLIEDLSGTARDK